MILKPERWKACAFCVGMPFAITQQVQDVSFSTIFRDIIYGVRDVAKAEMHVVRVSSAKVFVFGFLAMVGVIPIIASAVLALGKILDEAYWLSSLIVGVALLSVGGSLAARSARKIGGRSYESRS